MRAPPMEQPQHHARPAPPLRVAIQCRPLALGAGGMERTATKLANHLVAAGHHAALIYAQGKTAPIYPIDPRVGQFAIPSGRLDPLAHAKAALEFRAEVVLHLYPDASAIPYIRAMAEADIPVILHEATNPDRLLGPGWAERLRLPPERAQAQRDALTTVASHVRVTLPAYCESFSPRVRERVVAFPNAFPPALPECTTLHRDPERPRRFIQIGGLKPNKNLLPALRAFLLIADRIPDWRFVVFSDTPPDGGVTGQVAAALAASPHRGRVDIFPPTVAIDREYAGSDVHVIPSLSEGLPNCVAEAMRHGLPSIGFSCCPGTNSLIVDKQNGLLVPCENGDPDPDDGTDGLARAMLRLARDADLRRRLGAQALADSAVFDPDRINREWQRLLRRAARGPGFRARIAAADPLLVDDGPQSTGRLLVTGLGFDALPATLRPRRHGGWLTVDAAGEASASGPGHHDDTSADVIAWVDAETMPAPVTSSLAHAPDWATGRPILRLQIADTVMQEASDIPFPALPHDGAALALLGMVGAVRWLPARGAPGRPAMRHDLDWHLAAAARTAAALRSAGATASLWRASELRAHWIGNLNDGDGSPPFGATGAENWRRWYETDPTMVHRVRPVLPDFTLRTWLVGVGADELAASADWLLRNDHQLHEIFRRSPFERLFLRRRNRLAAIKGVSVGGPAR